MQKTQNLQDTFLNYIRREKIPVTLFLMNGFQLRGIVRSFDSFAVLIEADADRLNLGGSATLDFPQHYSGTVSATVFSKSEPDSSGEVAVVFACNNALADTLAMRKATADVVYSEHTGLRVPLKAVHMDDDGQTFVYVVTAAQLEKKPIEIIYQTDSYCLVAQSTDSNALRAGNDIVVSGKGLSDGQVIK